MNKHILLQYRPPRIAMSLVLIAAAAHWLLPGSLHAPLPPLAAVTGILGFATMIRAWWLFKIAGTAICPTATSTTLVTGDVFSITRNPMYLGMLLMLAALALATGTAPFYIAALGFGTVMDRVFCPYEEQKALAEFGDAFTTYARNVRRWL